MGSFYSMLTVPSWIHVFLGYSEVHRSLPCCPFLRAVRTEWNPRKLWSGFTMTSRAPVTGFPIWGKHQKRKQRLFPFEVSFGTIQRQSVPIYSWSPMLRLCRSAVGKGAVEPLHQTTFEVVSWKLVTAPIAHGALVRKVIPEFSIAYSEGQHQTLVPNLTHFVCVWPGLHEDWPSSDEPFV